jgi:hypothetical protein
MSAVVGPPGLVIGLPHACERALVFMLEVSSTERPQVGAASGISIADHLS